MDLNDVNDPPHELLRNQTSFQPPPPFVLIGFKIPWFTVVLQYPRLQISASKLEMETPGT